MVERHVWQDALDEITSFTKTPQGRSIYNRRKETIERSFAEAKVNARNSQYARTMLPDRRDSEYQEDGLLFLLSSLLLFSTTKPRLCCLTGFVNGLGSRAI